jgi:hypothetical protein
MPARYATRTMVKLLGDSRHEHTIDGLLQKRHKIIQEITVIREQLGVLANDIETIDQVLEKLGYAGLLEAVPHLPRRVVFYRGQLRRWLLTQLREHGPATSRMLAKRLAQVQRKDLRDKRLMDELAMRIIKLLDNMRTARLVIRVKGKKRSENFWKLPT